MGRKRRNKSNRLSKIPIDNLETEADREKAINIQVADELARYNEEQRKRKESGW